MKGMVTWFAENHVAANLLMLFILIGGVIVSIGIKLEVFPEMTMDYIYISTIYPGASPEEVESSVVRRVEESVAGLAGVKQLSASIREGVGTVTIEVIKDWDLKKLVSEVKAEIDRINTFPEEAEKPVVQEVTRRMEVISIAVYGDVQERTLKRIAENIRNDVTNLPGITMANLTGVRGEEIQIEISETMLRRYHLTLGQVANAIRQASLDLPAGSVKTADGEILIRTKGRRYYAEKYHDVAIISKADGTMVTLGQIATLKNGFENIDIYSRFQSKPAAMVSIYSVADQNALTVAGIVKEYVERIRPTLPEGAEIAFFNDMSIILKSRIELLLKNMAYGLILVILLLGFFLKWRLAFWVTLGIPISFAAGLMILPQFDVSINMISLFAFIMVLGIVVDDAIIVGENIFRRHEEGENAFQGAVDGALEVGRPVIFAVLTSIVAFCPILYTGGIMGKMLRNIPIVVIAVLAASLIECLLILPAHLSRSRQVAVKRKGDPNKVGIMSRWLKSVIHGPYTRLISFCVRWRYATIAVGIASLMLSFGLWQGGFVKFIFFPRLEGDMITCSLTMPTGKPIEQTEEVVAYLEQAARTVFEDANQHRPEDAPPLFEYSFSLIGAQMRMGPGGGGGAAIGTHLAQIMVQLLESEKRDLSATELSNRWREKAGHIPLAESITFSAEMHGAGKAIQVNLSLDNNEKLMACSEELKEELQKIPGVFDIMDSYLPGKKEMQLKLKPTARSLGLTLNALAAQTRHAFYGAEALRLQRDEDEVKVMVRYPEDERRSLGDVENMRIRTPAGLEVPFNEVAEVKMERGYASLQRVQRQRVITISGSVDETVNNSNEIRKILAFRYLPQLKDRYPGLRYTMEGEGKEQAESLGDTPRGFVIALFCIYALLAIPFKSFTQPFIVMAAIPFGFVGAIVGHLIMGYNLSMLSLLGGVGLAGVVVNDSLVLIHATNRIRDLGKSAQEAIIQAGALRFRAIVLTSLTTFAGLIPILMERSMQARFMIPMAISLGFGVLFATGITLILVPCLYMVRDDAISLIARIMGKSVPDVRS